MHSFAMYYVWLDNSFTVKDFIGVELIIALIAQNNFSAIINSPSNKVTHHKKQITSRQANTNHYYAVSMAHYHSHLSGW